MILGRDKLWFHTIGLRCVTAQHTQNELDIGRQGNTLSFVGLSSVVLKRDWGEDNERIIREVG